MTNQSPEKQVEEVMPRVSLAVIIGSTIVAFLLAIMIDAGLASFNKMLITGSVLLVGISDLLIARLVVLPALSRDPNSSRAHLFTVGYAHATSFGAFAIVTAIFVNEWWLALSFGALGMVFWLVVRDFVDSLPTAGSGSQAA